MNVNQVTSNSLVTIIIVTYNRSFFLRRLLNYYKDIKFDQNIIVADASDAEEKKVNEAIYENVKHYINIDVHFLHGKNVIECIDYISASIKTPYSVLNPDDDYLIPKNLTVMTRYLLEFTKYIGINGSAVLVNEKIIDSRSKIITTGQYSMRAIKGEMAYERLENLFKNYFGVLFSVFRTEAFVSIFRVSNGSSIIASELIPASRAVLLGEIAHINDLMICRSANEFRVKKEDSIKQIFSSTWSNEINLFKNDMVLNLMDIDGESHDKALDKVGNILCAYYLNIFSQKTGVNLWTRIMIFCHGISRRPLIRSFENYFYPWKKEFKIIRNSIENNYDK